MLVSSILAAAVMDAIYWAYQEFLIMHEEFRYHQMLITKGKPSAETEIFLGSCCRRCSIHVKSCERGGYANNNVGGEFLERWQSGKVEFVFELSLAALL